MNKNSVETIYNSIVDGDKRILQNAYNFCICSINKPVQLNVTSDMDDSFYKMNHRVFEKRLAKYAQYQMLAMKSSKILEGKWK